MAHIKWDTNKWWNKIFLHLISQKIFLHLISQFENENLRVNLRVAWLNLRVCRTRVWRVAMVASAAPAAGAGTGPSQQAQTCSSFCYKTFLLRVQPQSENSFRYTRTSMSLFKVGWEQMHKTLNLTLTSKQNGSFFWEFITLTHTNTHRI